MLGTSLVVSMLALSAMVLQRIQNRTLAAAMDIEQSQLNAQTAVELGLFLMKQDDEWRTAMGAGARTLSTILNWPWLWRYGYLPPGRRRAVAPASRSAQ